MPANFTDTGVPADRTSVAVLEELGKGCGRKRYCKKCKFTCTDSREFTTHRSTHTESDEDTQSPVTSLSQISIVTNSGIRRAFKPKRISKARLSTNNTMEPVKNNIVSTNSSFVNNTEKVAHTADDEYKNSNSELHQGDITSCHSYRSKQSMPSEQNEDFMETEEKGDEPDTMISLAPHKDVSIRRSISNEISMLPSEVIDSFSGDEEDEDIADSGDDDDDKLFIDDDGFNKATIKLESTQNRVYTCRQCEMTTTKAKSYLRHLNNDHNIEFSVFECNLCDYATVYKQQMSKHRKLHCVATEVNSQSSSCTSLPQSSPLTIKDKQSTPLASKDENSVLSTSFQTSSKQDLYNLDETDDMNDDGSNTPSPRNQISSPTPSTITTENIDKVLDDDRNKKKKTRQEVDPWKYFEAVDSCGTKYACSQCGNIYKWRKSLNKHWKEKHNTEPLTEVSNPPGMVELLKSGRYTQMGSRRIYDKIFLDTIKTEKQDPSCEITTHNSFNRSPSPSNYVKSPRSLPVSACNITAQDVYQNHKMIGPFIPNTAQPVFPGMPMTLPQFSLNGNTYDSSDESALDLSHDSKPDARNSPHPAVNATCHDHKTSLDQDQPLDFSKNSKSHEKTYINPNKTAHSINKLLQKQQHRSKPGSTSSNEVELTNHTNYHASKRIARCFECKQQCNSVDELNTHFIKIHFRKLSEYKEAVKKIPHGLQQTYHLLNMEIQDIGELNSQDLGASEEKSLKCKKCDFEAKWPAELQKHAVSHSEERPYICMVCGSTYKWKWDLVKHFQKSHPNLPNPYRRNDKKDTPSESSGDEEEPMMKRHKFDANHTGTKASLCFRDDTVEGIIATTNSGQRLVSKQQNIPDNETSMERNIDFHNELSSANRGEAAYGSQAEVERCNKIQDGIRIQHNSGSSSNGSNCGKKFGSSENLSSIQNQVGLKSEELPLPYKCTMCNYHARWPSEVTQHMKNHSDSKPYLCPRCEYRSKWKWDVVKHLKRCGGGGINDVIDTTKSRSRDTSMNGASEFGISNEQEECTGIITEHPPVDENDQRSTPEIPHRTASSGIEHPRPESSTSSQDNSSITNNNDITTDNNTTDNNNHTAGTNGLSFTSLNHVVPRANKALSTIGNSRPSISPTHPSIAQSTNSKQYSGEVWNCPHCPFTTHSQAELKRHADLHSDDKPFKCDVCQYSTRWACDLKKHRKSYNHFPGSNNSKEKCHPRFKCSQCVLYFETLQNLLEHRLSEHVGQDSSRSSPTALTENDIDMARIKHPRKQMRQFQCSKCPFVCKSRQTMEGHMDDHEQLEMGGINCFYCSSLFKNKEYLLDHISTHSAFSPKEWETFFMITDEDQQQPKAAKKRNHDRDTRHHDIDRNESKDNMNYIKDTEMDKTTVVVSTEARIQQILNEIPKQRVTLQKTSHLNRFKCEWCPAEFVHLTSAYNHARQVHPIQLEEQNINTKEDDHVLLAKQPSNHQAAIKKPVTKEPIDILKQQIEDKRNYQLAEKYFDNTSPKVYANVEEEKDVTLYSCDQCNVTLTDSSALQSHYELFHSNKLASQCWFCDFSVDHMNLLYQHMKISHTRKWKALSQDIKSHLITSC